MMNSINHMMVEKFQGTGPGLKELYIRVGRVLYRIKQAIEEERGVSNGKRNVRV